MKLLVAIPALNEEQSIRRIVERCLTAREYIVAHSPVTDVEITVVSDGSTDGTLESARQFEDRVRIIAFPENRGYGAAIMAAWADSDADLLGFLDADGTCEPKIFADLCRALDEARADVALGCRMAPGSRMPRVRRLGNRVFAFLLSTLSGKPVRDTASGMRVVRRAALRHLYPLPARLHFTPAMSARAALSDSTRLVEVDMPYAEREGRSKLSVVGDGVRFLSVIAGTALLYRPAKLLLPAAALLFVAAALLMAAPVRYYAATGTLQEWMIYRFLVCSFLAQAAALLWGAGAVANRMAAVALPEEVRRQPRLRLPSWTFGLLGATFVAAAVALIWPSAVQLIATGHTDVHWSRFVVALGLLSLVAIAGAFQLLAKLMQRLDERVRYLSGRS